MRHSESIAQVAAALAAAQGEFPPIPKDRTVTVTMKSGGKYTFDYAPLDTILACVRPALAKSGLALVQAVVEDAKGTELLRTTLMHSSGEWISNEIPVFTGGGDNASQAYGSGLTYARRYSLTALLCVAADEDTDGNGEDEDFERAPRQRNADNGKPAGQGKPTKGAKQDGQPGIFLSESQTKLLRAKAKSALPEHEEGVDAALVETYNRIDAKNVNAVLADLHKRAEAGQPA